MVVKYHLACAVSLSALIGVSAIPATASVSSLASGLEAMGVDISFDRETSDASRIILDGVRFASEEMSARASRLIYLPENGAIQIQELILGEPGQTDVETAIRTLTATSTSVFALIALPDGCAYDADLDPAVEHIDMQDIQLATGASSGNLIRPEMITIGRLEGSFQSARGDACIHYRSFSASDISVAGSDRSTLDIGSFDFSTSLSDPSRIQASSRLENVTAIDAGSGLMMRVGALHFEVEGESIPEDVELLDQLDSAAAIQILENLSATMSLSMDSFFMQMPPEADVQDISGDAQFTLVQRDGKTDIDLEMDIRNVLSMGASLGLEITPTGQSMGLAALLEDVPGMGLIERLALRHLTFSLEDRGAAEFSQSVSGIGPAEMLLELEASLSNVPKEASDAILAFARDALSGGAAMRAAPPQPVALTHIAMTGLLQPALLGSILAMDRE